MIAAKEGLHAALGVPVCVGNDVLGVMEFFTRQVRVPDDHALQMMEGIGSQIGRFMEQKNAEDALRASEKRFRDLLRMRPLPTTRLIPTALSVESTARSACCSDVSPRKSSASTHGSFSP